MTASDGAAPARSRRTSLLVTVAAIALLAGGVVAIIATRGPDDPVAEALVVARPADGYDTGLEAGQTLARVASALNRGIRDCDRATEPDRCAALGSASGYVQVAAATVVRCTAPGRSEARAAVIALLEAVRAREPGDPPPPTPALPSCRR